MKKSKLAIGLMTAMLSAGVLASCDNVVKYSKSGVILTYVDENGKEQSIKADALLKDYYNDSTKYQSIFDQINSIVIRNYFTTNENVTYQGQSLQAGLADMPQIKVDAQYKVDSDKRTAETNADNNGTSYSDEFDSILASKGVEDEDELFEYYVKELQKEKFEENFYKYHVDDLKLGATDVKNGDKNYWEGYFHDMKPYHVSHILVKLEDGSGTNYSNGTVSKDNAEKLYEVVDALKNGEDSFGTLAKQFSEDTGSAKSYGDLGIMDYSTGYVNEFKLGVYAYENLFSEKAKDDDVLKIPNATDYKAVTKESFGSDFPEIPFSVFKEMKTYADKTKDGKEKSVLDDSANFYPRNIVYNKYLNRHSIAFITGTDADVVPTDSKATTGFIKYDASVPGLDGKVVLSVKAAGGWTPVLVARAGSDYQGIHFIIVNRSPFEGAGDTKVVAGVSLNDYYTTYYPDQAGYPTDDSDTPLKTYINFSSSVTADTKSRADSLKSTLKSFDSDKLNKYIFKKYFQIQGLKIVDEDLEAALYKWLDRSVQKKAEETTENWEKTWNDYVETLRKQNSERTKLVSEACKIGYEYANDTRTLAEVAYGTGTLYTEMAAFLTAEGHADKIEEYLGAVGSEKKVVDLFKLEGGLCNDGKAHL